LAYEKAIAGGIKTRCVSCPADACDFWAEFVDGQVKTGGAHADPLPSGKAVRKGVCPHFTRAVLRRVDQELMDTRVTRKAWYDKHLRAELNQFLPEKGKADFPYYKNGFYIAVKNMIAGLRKLLGICREAVQTGAEVTVIDIERALLPLKRHGDGTAKQSDPLLLEIVISQEKDVFYVAYTSVLMARVPRFCGWLRISIDSRYKNW
jgi:hypothetical protein